MSTRRELISSALQKRFEEVCGGLGGNRISRLSPAEFSGRERFVTEVQARFLNSSPAEFGQSLAGARIPDNWMSGETDCLSSLLTLSVGNVLQLRPGQHPPIDPFISSLHQAGRDPEKTLHLLLDRYGCPLNFTLPGEAEAREYVLMRLMVHDRARIEKHSLAACNSDELLLKLNLVAINAAVTTDLRFLDALNYYYELMPATWRPDSPNGWLLVSYFILYARALVAWL